MQEENINEVMAETITQPETTQESPGAAATQESPGAAAASELNPGANPEYFKLMLDATTTNTFKESFKAINKLIVESFFILDGDGITFKNMSPCNVSMVNYRIQKERFTIYELNPIKDSTTIIKYFNVKSLNEILKQVTKKDNLIIETDKNNLRITIKGILNKVFNIPLLDLDGVKEQKVPELKQITSLVIPTETYKEIVTAAKTADSIKITVTPGTSINFNAAADLNNLDITLTTEQNITINAAEKTVCKYSLEYLSKFVLSSKVFNQVNLKLGNDYPLSIIYRNPGQELLFILAPRVQNETD